MDYNAQLCKLIGYMESTSNTGLIVILGDFNYAAIDWNSLLNIGELLLKSHEKKHMYNEQHAIQFH